MTNAIDRALGRNTDRPDMVLNKLSRWQWGPERKRVVRVCVTRGDDDVLTAQVFGVDGTAVVELQRATATAVLPGRPLPVVQLAEGQGWSLGATGCGCNTPPPLLGFNPLRSTYRELGA